MAMAPPGKRMCRTNTRRKIQKRAMEKTLAKTGPAWKTRKAAFPTTGMARRLFHGTDYLGGQEEIHHGHFHAWHRPE
jgi:hypothetical protein